MGGVGFEPRFIQAQSWCSHPPGKKRKQFLGYCKGPSGNTQMGCLKERIIIISSIILLWNHNSETQQKTLMKEVIEEE